MVQEIIHKVVFAGTLICFFCNGLAVNERQTEETSRGLVQEYTELFQKFEHCKKIVHDLQVYQQRVIFVHQIKSQVRVLEKVKESVETVIGNFFDQGSDHSKIDCILVPINQLITTSFGSLTLALLQELAQAKIITPDTLTMYIGEERVGKDEDEWYGTLKCRLEDSWQKIIQSVISDNLQVAVSVMKDILSSLDEKALQAHHKALQVRQEGWKEKFTQFSLKKDALSEKLARHYTVLCHLKQNGSNS